MRRINSILLISCLLLGLMAGCKSSKTISTKEQKLELDECIKLAEQKPEIRAWGDDISFNLSDAKAYAETRARATMGRNIQSAIESGIQYFSQEYHQSITDTKESAMIVNTDNDGKQVIGDYSKTIIDINNTTTIKTNAYRMKDGRYHVYVCIEYKNGISQLAKAITQRISDEDKLKIDFKEEEFRKWLEDKGLPEAGKNQQSQN